MDEEFLRVMESKKYLDDQIALSQVQQPAFGKAVSTKEVDDAVLFMDDNLKIMDDNLKILATSPYAKSLNNMHKIDDTSTISLRYAITEYFNVIYYDNLLTPGSRCKYAINDTKNIVKHLNFLRQSFENIVQHKSLFPIGRIARKWENLHKALI